MLYVHQNAGAPAHRPRFILVARLPDTALMVLCSLDQGTGLALWLFAVRPLVPVWTRVASHCVPRLRRCMASENEGRFRPATSTGRVFGRR